MNNTVTLAVLVFGLAACAAADTIYLNNGVRFDGVVRERPDGNYLVDAGGRKIIYRAAEVARIEQNNRTGAFDKEAARRRWAERDAELTELTGLTTDQRRRVEALMFELRTPHPGDRQRIRERLAAMQAEVDIVPFLAMRLRELSHRFSPWVLETIVILDPRRSRDYAREYMTHTHAGTRATAIELAGRLGDAESAGAMARGLVDHAAEVRIAAAYALAAVKARNASPALLQLLEDPDMKVINAARSALKLLYQDETEGRSLLTLEEWRGFYDSLTPRPEGTFALEGLEPLIPEHLEFEDE